MANTAQQGCASSVALAVIDEGTELVVQRPGPQPEIFTSGKYLRYRRRYLQVSPAYPPCAVRRSSLSSSALARNPPPAPLPAPVTWSPGHAPADRPSASAFLTPAAPVPTCTAKGCPSESRVIQPRQRRTAGRHRRSSSDAPQAACGRTAGRLPVTHLRPHSALSSRDRRRHAGLQTILRGAVRGGIPAPTNYKIQYNTNCKHFYSFSSSVSPTRHARRDPRPCAAASSPSRSVCTAPAPKCRQQGPRQPGRFVRLPWRRRLARRLGRYVHGRLGTSMLLLWQARRAESLCLDVVIGRADSPGPAHAARGGAAATAVA